MNEHRVNWKAELSKQAQERANKRQSLLIALEELRKEIRFTGRNFERYDALKAKQRETIAQLATL